jgi:hypothetical protein
LKKILLVGGVVGMRLRQTLQRGALRLEHMF